MLRVEFVRWGQTLEDLRRASLDADHPRTRERFQALYLIASGQFNATTCAAHIHRQDETVLTWIHRYHRSGPDALIFRHTGGSAPFLPHPKRNKSWTPSRTVRLPTTACPATSGP